jgi:hypothetical protein
MRRSACFLTVLGVLLAAAAPGYTQGGTTSTITGQVVDSSGAVVPGADVTATHVATNTISQTVSNAEGLFTLPGLQIGVYTVTVTLQGFKSFRATDVVLTSGAGANVRATLEIGGLSEQVLVMSTSEVVQTQSSTVSTTINTNQITKLPLTTRSAMDFVNLLPGVSTPAGNRDATINGLPRGTINITLDGVNVQDNTLRSTDGFFAIVSPRLDAIEEVTVTTASQGAGDAGQGAVQVKFVTRAGTNNLDASGYYYYRSDKLNANTWFNNRNGVDKAKLLQKQGGFRAGGPIVLPGFDGHNKAFFFMNYEQVTQPSDTTRNNRIVLNTAAMNGDFSYVANGVTQTVNVLQLAARNGQLSTLDPTMSKMLQEIRSAVASTGSLEFVDPNLQRFTFNVPVASQRYYPTFRLDYNLSDRNRASFAYNYQKFTDAPDTLNNQEASFPGFPVAAGQTSIRLGWSGSVRTTLTNNIVNEARLGYSGSPVSFFDEFNKDMFTGSAANQQGFSLRFPTINSALTSPGPAPAPQSRNANTLLVEDTVTWLKGRHSVSLGGSFTQYDVWAKNQTLVPSMNFDMVTNDPATALFNAANFPGASATNVTAAGRLYALLTGRVSSITGNARLNESTAQYEYLGVGLQRGRLREAGGYVQDAFRVSATLTLNAGVRYDIQQPFYPLNSLYSYATIDDVCGISGKASDTSCNLFQAGKTPGATPTFKKLEQGTKSSNVDYNNIAPSVGLAWTPSATEGLLGALMGREGNFVIRGGYTRSFSRPGMNDFTSVFNANPGITITANREEGQGNLGTLPLLLRDQSRLGPPAFAQTPSYPMTDVVTEDVRIFDQNIQVPWAHSWSVGVQRGIGTSMALEVRYVGTRGKDQWRTQGNSQLGEIDRINFNEANIFENGFTNEFKQAQANLQANIAAGRGATFAYTGAAGTAPLPVFLGYFNGQPTSAAGNAGVYTGANWTNQTFLNYLAVRNPNPFGFASLYTATNNNAFQSNTNALMNNAGFRANALAAGIPANYFVANPNLLGGAFLVTNIGETKYDGLQLELRRRYSGGLQFQTSYAFGHAYVTDFESVRRDQFWIRDAGTPGDLTHQFKGNFVYDLPFGPGRRWGANANGFVSRVVGGWQVGLSTRLQSGRLIDLGNVRMVGMSRDDVEGMFKLRIDAAGRKVWMLPQDIIDQTINAFSVSATSPTGYAGAAPTGRYFGPANGPDCIEVDSGAEYGACAARSLVVSGPIFQQHDLRISKRTKFASRGDFEFAIEALNMFNNVNFVPVGGIGSTLANYEVTALTGTNNARVIQLVTRINW